jgi:DHA2 family multidrug resistance protein
MTAEEAARLSPEESERITREQGWTGGYNPWTVALVVTMATFMEVLDTAIANVSLPHIAGSLSASIDQSTWVLTSYLVSNAVVLPISGWLANRVGRKRFYMSCVVLFTISSFLCGIAPNLPLLIFFRVLQGIGGGGLGPSEQAILADTFPPAKRGMAFAVYGMAVVLAPAIGPTLGGFITDHYSWRWVFFINVPVGAISLILSGRILVDPPHLIKGKIAASKAKVDWSGLGLIAVGLGALEYVLDKGQEDDWFHSHTIVVMSIIAAVCLVSFVVWEWRNEHPVVDVKLFKDSNFAIANLMMLILGMTLYGSTVLLPQYLQVWMGYSAQDSGMALSPGGFVVIIMLPFIGRMIGKVDTRYLIAFGFFSLTLALWHFAHTLYPGIAFIDAVLLRVYLSFGIAFLFVPINTVIYNGIPPSKNNQVSGIVNLFRNMGGDIGIAFVATAVARRSQHHQAILSSHITNGPALDAMRHGIATTLIQRGVAGPTADRMALGSIYGQLVKQAQTLAYADVIMVFCVFAALMVPAVLLTHKAKPAGGASMAH